MEEYYRNISEILQVIGKPVSRLKKIFQLSGNVNSRSRKKNNIGGKERNPAIPLHTHVLQTRFLLSNDTHIRIVCAQ